MIIQDADVCIIYMPPNLIDPCALDDLTRVYNTIRLSAYTGGGGGGGALPPPTGPLSPPAHHKTGANVKLAFQPTIDPMTATINVTSAGPAKTRCTLPPPPPRKGKLEYPRKAM